MPETMPGSWNSVEDRVTAPVRGFTDNCAPPPKLLALEPAVAAEPEAAGASVAVAAVVCAAGADAGVVGASAAGACVVAATPANSIAASA
jgi:hypothetical protein